jgi:hypothetical protein
VESADEGEERKNVRRLKQGVIVVRENTPGKNPVGPGVENLKQAGGKVVHSQATLSNHRRVVVAGCRQMKSQVSVIGPMGRRMPRKTPPLPPLQQFLPLGG